jgi:TolB protein
VAISGLNAGRHSVTLYGIAANCVLSGVNTRAVDVLAGDTVRVAFDVACTAVGGASGQIAFVSDRDGNFEIYLMKADGSSQTRLTNNPATDFQPAWSPDGKKIAFTSPAEVYVMNADGSSPTRLTYSRPDWDSADQAAWSPDGSKIAVTRASVGYCDPDGLCSGSGSTLVISVINADGTGIHDLASGSGAAWSPDGTRIAFRGDGGINVLNTDGSGGRHVIAAIGGQHLAWSPDAAKIAFDGATYTSPLSAPRGTSTS